MKRKLVYDEAEVDFKRCRSVTMSDDHVTAIDFEPSYFLRCHSKSNDNADVSTQVWQCSFEPHGSNLVATCGGNSVCFINVVSGQVEGKYYSDIRDYFYTLCWTTISKLNNEENVLAVAGASRFIHLLHPKEGVVFFKYDVKKSLGKSLRAGVVSSLLFHPHENNLLICSQSDGDVNVFDIGCPLPPQYKTTFIKLYTLCAEMEIFSLAFSSETHFLLAACSKGLRGWKILDEESMKNAPMLAFDHPPMPGQKSRAGDQLVDSVEVLSKNLVATKCALHGNIYVWDIKDTLKEFKNENLLRIVPTYVLKWKDTDNYFMNMGCNDNFLISGDDKGAIWIYDACLLISGSDLYLKEQRNVKPIMILPWPEIEDMYLARKRKLQLDLFDIVIDKVVVNRTGSHVVAVTSNNMVCIWKKVKI